MKKSLIALAVLSAVAVPAFAQNSVTLYGIIDAGLDYNNNSKGTLKTPGGYQLWQMQSGIMQGSRWGLKGVEDLGGGTKAIFQLENGFNVMNGKLGQGGLEFGRQAYVGVTNGTYGTLTLGRQYDPVVDLVQPTTMNGTYGAFFSHAGDIDNSDNSFRVNNAVKYVSPSFYGVSAEGFYAFGGQAGNFRQNSTIAGGLNYSGGPIYLGFAYFYARNPASQFADGNFVASNPANPDVSNNGPYGFVGNPYNMQTYAVGGTYTIGSALIGLDYTHVSFNDANSIVGNTVRFENYEVWGKYFITPALEAALGYTFTDGHVDAGGLKPKYNQFNAVVDYHLSKRTDVYVMGVFEHATGGANADIYDGVAGAQSSTQNQVVARVGIRHKF
jgi:predicted porin